MEYVAKFIELARFGDDYVATDMAKVRRFENGLKLSIRGKIVGLRPQDMDSMVGTNVLKIGPMTEPEKLPVHSSLVGLVVESRLNQ